MDDSIVGLAISWLGDRFHRPLIRVSKIGRNGDFLPLGRHDAIDLWRRPNKWYGRRTMEKAIGLSLKVDGNAYIYKKRDDRGRLIELWWIPHFRILPTWPSDGSEYIDGFRVWLDTAVYDLPPEDIIHIRDGIDPRNERLGLAALRASLREVVTINYEGSYTAGILKNGGVPGVILSPVINDVTAKHVRNTPEAAERYKERFHEEFGIDQDKAGSVLITNTPYEVKAVGFSPEQMTLDKLPQTAVGRISAALGVAPMSMGLPDPQKTYANLSEANRTSWGSIISIQELIAGRSSQISSCLSLASIRISTYGNTTIPRSRNFRRVKTQCGHEHSVDSPETSSGRMRPVRSLALSLTRTAIAIASRSCRELKAIPMKTKKHTGDQC